MRTTNSYSSFPAINYYNPKVNQSGTSAAEKDKKITQAEFINARPNTVTREAATDMFAKLDTAKAGVLARDQITTELKKYIPVTDQISKLSDSILTTLLIRIKAMKDTA